MTDWTKHRHGISTLDFGGYDAHGETADTHAEGENLIERPRCPGRLGYGMIMMPQPAGPEMVEISLDDLDKLKDIYPNFGVEAYGPRPASDQPIHFVYADKVKMMEKYGYEPDPALRIAVVFYRDGKPHSAKILKSEWEKIK